MSQRRSRHTLSALPDGQLIAVGGWDGANALSSVETLDPLSGAWTTATPLRTARWGHTATTLPDGRLFIAGGVGADDRSIASTEFYDPATGAWTDGPPLIDARDSHTVAALTDGRVLLAGGYGADGAPLASAELYDPATGAWSSAGNMAERRAAHTVTALPDGRALIVGGTRDGITPLATAEIFNPHGPRRNLWSSGGALRDARWGHTALLTEGGQVQIVGGFGFSALDSVEVYTPSGGGWYSGERLALNFDLDLETG